MYSKIFLNQEIVFSNCYYPKLTYRIALIFLMKRYFFLSFLLSLCHVIH